MKQGRIFDDQFFPPEVMTTNNLLSTVCELVERSQTLVRKYTNQPDVPVNYACIFSHSDKEYDELFKSAQGIGQVVKDTPTGSVFQIEPLQTVAGPLQLLKIRQPDPTRPERGDADFTVPDYTEFKEKFLKQPGFSLLQRSEMEMIELTDPAFDVRAYFSSPTLAEQLGIR